MKSIFSLVILICFLNLNFASAKTEDCAKPDAWAPTMAKMTLKNMGHLSATGSEENLDRTKVVLMAQQKLNSNLFKQILKITFFKKNGESIVVITENDVSKNACSMGPVNVHIISSEVSSNAPIQKPITTLPYPQSTSMTCRNYPTNISSCFIDLDGDEQKRCRVCKEKQSCFIALEGVDRELCSVYMEDKSCFMSNLKGEDKLWCEVIKENKNCFIAFKSNPKNKKDCEEGLYPEKHLFWSAK